MVRKQALRWTTPHQTRAARLSLEEEADRNAFTRVRVAEIATGHGHLDLVHEFPLLL
jgi:hypothetical protein